jgi:hypothetical protein
LVKHVAGISVVCNAPDIAAYRIVPSDLHVLVLGSVCQAVAELSVTEVVCSGACTGSALQVLEITQDGHHIVRLRENKEPQVLSSAQQQEAAQQQQQQEQLLQPAPVPQRRLLQRVAYQQQQQQQDSIATQQQESQQGSILARWLWQQQQQQQASSSSSSVPQHRDPTPA